MNNELPTKQPLAACEDRHRPCDATPATDAPLVSVLIPTYRRPRLVVRAVRSALAQTLASVEVIVVLDGPDEATEKALTALHEPRVRVHSLSRHAGPSAARNAGVDAARGRWIAFLDDDDEWRPEKLAVQLRTATDSACETIVACRCTKRSEEAAVVLPRRLPSPGESVGDYLLRRTQWFGGESLVPFSTILASRDLLRRVRFREDLGRHEDLDWLLRASGKGAVQVRFADSAHPLVLWNKEEHRASLSTSKDWRASFSWIRQSREWITPQAYASFLLTWASANAVEQEDRSAFWPLLAEAFRRGSPGALDIALFVGIWLMPRGLRQRLSTRCTGRRTL